MTSTTTSTPASQIHHLPLHERRERSAISSGHTLRKYPTHLLAYSIISILVFLCWLPDFIVALKDVSVTIPQAVKRGSNAMLTCNYDMENDTLYSVKWYKGRREFYRYTPKENPAMKVFLSQSGLNVERNLSNQSHVVLLAVPLNISGKFTCEISVEAPSFQTAMVSGEMEVVELPEEQASVTGIQPRYRIGDLVDGNCSIKYSKPAANLTWTINGIVVPPHHIKTYQIEKYEETNLESVMSAIHFMVTTQHFVKGQMRLKCTAGIFNIFKEEIESVIEEDRPRIMASGQSYPPDHGYGTHGESDGYEHNESYLTYFSAPKSAATRTAEFFITKILKYLHQEILCKFHLSLSLDDKKSQHMEYTLATMTFFKSKKTYLEKITQIKMTATTTYFAQLLQQMPMKCLITVMVILLVVIRTQWQKLQRKHLEMTTATTTTKNETKCNCNLNKHKKAENLAVNLWHEKLYKVKRRQQHQYQKTENENCYHDGNNDDCQNTTEHRQQHDEQCLVANQNVVNEKVFLKDTNIAALTRNTNEMTTSSCTSSSAPTIDCQRHMSQTFFTIPSFSSSCAMPSSSASTWGYRKTYAHDSLPLYAFDASKSNNAKYMSKDQTLLMTSPTSIATAAAVAATSPSTSTTASFMAAPPSSGPALGADTMLLPTTKQLSPSPLPSSSASSVSRNSYLMAFIGELLLHQC